MRDLVRQQLPTSAFTERGILKEEAPYVAVLTRSGYEFIVAFFAVRVLGGAPIPFGAYLFFPFQSVMVVKRPYQANRAL